MLMGMSAVDRKWLTRILLKKMHLGIGDKRMLEFYDKRAFDLYAQCNRLSDVCKAIESNSVPENEPSNGLIQIFSPLRSMLCERGYISQINQVSIMILFEHFMLFIAINFHKNIFIFVHFSSPDAGKTCLLFGNENGR